MTQRIIKLGLCLAAVGIIAVAAPLTASAKKRHHRAHRANANVTKNASSSNGEVDLTGTDLQQASDAALTATGGGTVDRATTDTDEGGAYEVFVTTTDGHHVKVIEDASFSVLRVIPAGPGGPGGSGCQHDGS